MQIDPVRGGIDHQVSIGESRGAASVPSAYECLGSQGELAGAERLGDVVVGPCFQPTDPVRLVRQRGDHHDGYVRDSSDAFSHGDPGDHRNHEVKNHEIEATLFEGGPGLCSISRGDNSETRCFEGEAHNHQDLWFVVDDENLGCAWWPDRVIHWSSPPCGRVPATCVEG